MSADDQRNLNAHRDRIAVIGVGCRFPGADGPAAFWRLVRDGVDAVGEIPGDRFDVEALYDPRPGIPGKISTRWGGYLDRVDEFDAQFFGISPREAQRLDPQQRLLLEVAWESLEDAGQPIDRIDGARTGVFVGMWLNDYEARLFRNPREIDFYMTTGSGRYSASGRLSYAFGFEGPSITIDCACSSSLVAVHLACHSLWSGESTLALAAGANTIFEPSITIAYSQSRMMAPDGRCKFGDARANGYVRSEGAAVVVLKPLTRAMADGDPIYAVIRGSAVNNDGRSSGFLATPGQLGQETMLRRAYEDAGISPQRVHYVEAHGTGTSKGDPVEIGAIGAVLGAGRPAGQPCRVGSVKTNIGHTEGAAGLAGLIKVALALKHEQLPPSLHFQQPNPGIPWERLNVAVQQALEPWPTNGELAVAGVSSFGIAGTNAHVVLEQFATTPRIPQSASGRNVSPCVVPLSAQSSTALKAVAASWRAFLSDAHSDCSFEDLCYSAARRRVHQDHRLAVIAANVPELVSGLEAFLRGDVSETIVAGARDPERTRKAVFVFPGQGSQWLGMGRRLLSDEPVFRRAIEECDAAVRNETEWSVLAELLADDSSSRLTQIDVVQPVLFSVQVALAALWRSWGVEPSAVVGHSMGEVAASCVAGALSLEDAARVICRRSRLLRRTSGKGAMAVIGLSLEEAAEAIAGFEDRLSIAVSNSPRSTVISGDPDAIDQILQAVERRDVFCRRVKVDVASHSPQMDPLQADLMSELQQVRPRRGSLAICSTVLAAITDGSDFDAAYWVRNLRQPVLFSSAIQRLIVDGHDTFVEMSPHPLLVSAVQELLQDAAGNGIVVGSLRREEDDVSAILGSVAALHVGGYPVEWSRLSPAGRCVSLPSYPWQRERHWFQPSRGRAGMEASGRTGHPLLGSRVSSPITIFETQVSADSLPWLTSVRFDGIPLVPAASFVEMALAAAAARFGRDAHVIEHITFNEPVRVPEDGEITFQVVFTTETSDAASFSIFRLADGAIDAGAWTLCSTGTVRVDGSTSCDDADRIARAQQRCRHHTAGSEFYGSLTRHGVEVHDDARACVDVWSGDAERLASCDVPEAAAGDARRYTFHPAVLQACFDLLALSPELPEGFAWVPQSIATLRIAAPGREPAWCHVELRGHDASTATADARFHDADGRFLAALEGVTLRRARPASFAGSHRTRTADWVYEVCWERADDRVRADRSPDIETLSRTWILLGADQPVADAFSCLIEAQGGSSVLVRAGDRFVNEGHGRYRINPLSPADHIRLLHEVSLNASAPLGGILHLWSLGTSPEETVESIAADVRAVSLSAIAAAQAMSESHVGSTRLWLTTRGAQRVEEHEVPTVAQSPLWGMARALALEQPAVFGGIIDLDGTADDNVSAANVARAIASTDGENQIAFRRDVPFVPRLTRVAPSAHAATVSIRGDSSYLVTGGLGHLGLRVARWLTEQGAGHVVLLGRGGLPPRNAWPDLPQDSAAAAQVRAIDEMERLGTGVTVWTGDVADRVAMSALFARFGNEYTPLRGVVHAAGRIDYRPLAQIGPGEVDDVCRAKVQGTCVLDELTRRHPLDFFVLFSSGASVWGSRHLAHYAAANHFLDAVAAKRAAQGLPGLSINWGWWEGGATTAEADALFAQVGLQMMQSDAALGLMGDLLGAAAAQRTVAAIDWNIFKPLYEHTGHRFLQRIDVATAPTNGTGKRGELLRRVAALSANEALKQLGDYVRSEVGFVLRRYPGQLDAARGFFKLGMDSLMTVELRRRLEAALDRALPATIAFEYPTITALSRYLSEHVLGFASQGTEATTASASEAPSHDLIPEALDTQTDAELASLLDGEIARLLTEEERAN